MQAGVLGTAAQLGGRVNEMEDEPLKPQVWSNAAAGVCYGLCSLTIGKKAAEQEL